jgi:hypothetical protein
VYFVCFWSADRQVESEPVENFLDLEFDYLEQPAGFEGKCNHVNRAKHMADMGRLSQVTCYFPSFVDVRGRRKGWCNPDLR